MFLANKHPSSFLDSSLENPASKKQKITVGTSTMEIDPIVYNANKNTHLKGRRRFNADLADVESASAAGLVMSGLRVTNVCPGEDEGSVGVTIEKFSSEHVVSVNFFISDTSEYPSSHSLFCHSPDLDLSARLQRVVDDIPNAPPQTLGSTISDLAASVAQAIAASAQKQIVQGDDSENDDLEEEDDDEMDYDAFDVYDDIGAVNVERDSIMSRLQEEFVDTVATDYRPGFIRLSGNDFVISISLPVIKLAESIPPRALMAWDRRLLSSSQHLTLLISGFHGLYPVLENDASYTTSAQRLGVNLSFKVGLSQKYKPGRDQVQDVIRKHGLVMLDAEDELLQQAELAAQKARSYDDEDENSDEDEPLQEVVEEEEKVVIDPYRFDTFSLSTSLESLMEQSFLKLVRLRKTFNLGWAGAELLNTEIEKSQQKEDVVFAQQVDAIYRADQDEREFARTTDLPHDPLGFGQNESFNLPLTAFCYLVRRLSLCPKYCLVCHNRLHYDFEALKPYVCDSKLCSYQYYSLNRGPSLEYEITHNPQTVDLLVSLAYVSANEGAMEDPLPLGLGLRVPYTPNGINSHPQGANAQAQNPIYVDSPKQASPEADGMCDFDDLTVPQMRAVIVMLINSLPSIEDMRKHLVRKVKAGKSKPKLKDIDSNIVPAAWSILRWVVASCTAHIEAIESDEELIKNLDPNWRQFRLTVGAPDAEAKFKTAIRQAAVENANVKNYPVIYAFHGSGLKNWHSIIRHGLWYKTVVNGRAYGDGVYLAKDASTSMGTYASAARSSWIKSQITPTNCVALTEVVNLPAKFVSSHPHYVVRDTHWIMCRYLLVKGVGMGDPENPKTLEEKGSVTQIPYVKFDPNHKATVNRKIIEIPDPSYKVEGLLAARKADYIHENPDAEDLAIYEISHSKHSNASSQLHHYDMDDEDYFIPSSVSSRQVGPSQRTKDDWQHDPGYVNAAIENLMLPPFESSPSASMAIQRELKSMLREQEMAPCLKDLGWYMPPELIGDNLYQWIVEVHSLDPTLPIARDMNLRKLNSIIFEIRFPPTFPNSPPFFRIITPRFLPFIQGGGGHVTGGGSICMDLLTSDGWLPSYSISAVIMQIRLALSNLEPRPALLAKNWDTPYEVQEALVGFRRAAATHNWRVPAGLDRLVR